MERKDESEHWGLPNLLTDADCRSRWVDLELKRHPWLLDEKSATESESEPQTKTRTTGAATATALPPQGCCLRLTTLRTVLLLLFPSLRSTLLVTPPY